MKHNKLLLITLITLCFTFVLPIALQAQDIVLPAPIKTSSLDVLNAITARRSAPQKPFTATPVTDIELSTLLMSASGLTGPENTHLFAVPLALASAPYVDIYVLTAAGTWLYDWQGHKLLSRAHGGLMSQACLQPWAKTAPCVLVFVSKPELLKLDSLADVATGAMTQNIYLVCEALNLKTRYIMSFDGDFLSEALKLSSPARIICVMPVGHQ